MVVREFITMLGFEVDDKGMAQYENQMKEAQEQANDLGKNMMAAGAAITAAVGVPFLLLTKRMKNVARDAEETGHKFNVVFNGIEDASDKAAQKLVDDFDLSRAKAEKLLADTGDILVGFGFDRKEALELSAQTQTLAADLASLTNIQGGVDSASKALTSGLTGMRVRMKALGIVIRENDVKQRITKLQTEGRTFATKNEANAVATLQLAIEQSGNAIGDYARTRQSVANKERAWANAQQTALHSWGKVFLPIVGGFLTIAINLTKWLGSLSEATKRYVLVLGAMITTIGLALPIIGGLLLMLSKLSAFFMGAGGLAASFKLLLPLISGAIIPFAKLLLIVGAIALILEDIWTWTRGGRSLTGLILGDYEDAMSAYRNAWEELTGAVTEMIEGNFEALGKRLRKWVSTFGDLVTFFGDNAAEAVMNKLDDLMKVPTTTPTAASAGAGTVVDSPALWQAQAAARRNAVENALLDLGIMREGLSRGTQMSIDSVVINTSSEQEAYIAAQSVIEAADHIADTNTPKEN